MRMMFHLHVLEVMLVDLGETFPSQCWYPKLLGCILLPGSGSVGCWGNKTFLPWCRCCWGAGGVWVRICVMLKILNFSSVMIALVNSKSELLVNGKHLLPFLCWFLKETPNKTKLQRKKKNQTKNIPTENLSVCSLEKVGHLYFLFYDDI